MQYQQFMQQQPQMTPMGPMTQQQISSMTPDMRQQMNAMQNQADMQRRLASGDFPGAQGGMPGGIPVQRPMPFDPRSLPVGAGGKGAGMPPPGMVNPPRPMPLPPGLNRPMPMPMPPGNMVNPPRPMVQNPRAQAAQSANPLLAQMMRGGSR
jgi:hypothetical protein